VAGGDAVAGSPEPYTHAGVTIPQGAIPAKERIKASVRIKRKVGAVNPIYRSR